MLQFWIPNRLPGRNEQEAAARRHRQIAGKMKKHYTGLVAACIRGRPKATRRIHVTFYWIEPDARRDPDNIAGGMKFIFDALVARGVIPVDSRKWVAGFSHRFPEPDKKNPGVLVEVREEGA